VWYYIIGKNLGKKNFIEIKIKRGEKKLKIKIKTKLLMFLMNLGNCRNLPRLLTILIYLSSYYKLHIFLMFLMNLSSHKILCANLLEII
jgi:hypothetical protein